MKKLIPTIQGSLRTIWKSRFIRIMIPLLIAFGGFLDKRFGAELLSILMFSTSACLIVIFAQENRYIQKIEEQIVSTNYNTVQLITGQLISYLIATICILLLCWGATFPFSDGQSAGFTINGVYLRVFSQNPWPLMSKVFAANSIILTGLVWLRNKPRLSIFIAISYWLFSFIGIAIRGYLRNLLLGNSSNPLKILNFIPSFNVHQFYWAATQYWLLPTLGLVLILFSSYCFWLDYRYKKRLPVSFSKPLMLGLAIGGLICFVTGEILFKDMLQQYQLIR
ncbi:hypothetical protein [Herpetosiphon giganteus]|uniref:hypothetical protein n=1 Tax=Herpetosiphon giganteus TaxID=2029754 RepID=UPI00195E87B5|nr:hypothetical protein [Herpetosiphon giganteus]MBM7843070.1 hypothetical protein [Herpetosiphon giganteus]